MSAPHCVSCGHHWEVAIVSLCFITFRVGVRIEYFGRIWADDILIIGAWLMILATACLYQSQAINLYNHYPLVTGTLDATPGNLAKERTLLRVETAEFYLFYTALWSVKLSILLFFRRLFGDRQRVPLVKTWWWFITGFTVASWAACFGTIPYDCLLKPLPYILARCAVPNGIDYIWINLQLSCATDIVTDVLILTLPVVGLWNVRISPRKKLALMGIFSLTVIAILFAIVCIAVMPNKKSSADITWLCFWAHVETGAAVIVSCLASFRQLFVNSEQSTLSDKQSSDSKSSLVKNMFLRKTSRQSSNPSSILSSSRLRSLLPASQTHLQAAESLHSYHSSDTIPVDRRVGKSTIVYPGEMEKPLQQVYTTAYRANKDESTA